MISSWEQAKFYHPVAHRETKILKRSQHTLGHWWVTNWHITICYCQSFQWHFSLQPVLPILVIPPCNHRFKGEAEAQAGMKDPLVSSDILNIYIIYSQLIWAASLSLHVMTHQENWLENSNHRCRKVLICKPYFFLHFKSLSYSLLCPVPT